MSANSFGNRFQMLSFGESHGPALGAVIEGMPAGVAFDESLLTNNLARRKPGQKHTTERLEQDQAEVLSGIFENKSIGTPICVIVRNQDARSKDYEAIKNNPRPGHADDIWQSKFGHRDHRGGGRSSGRETLTRVIAGSFAEMLLRSAGEDIKVLVYPEQIAHFQINKDEKQSLREYLEAKSQEQINAYIDSFASRFPHQEKSKDLAKLLEQAKLEGKSYGGVMAIEILNTPKNLGQPVFHKLKAELGSALFSIGATIGLELGSGFSSSISEGSEFHDPNSQQGDYGGIRGGISTGERISLRLAMKPTATVLHVAKSGRHDPCILSRAVQVVQSMCYLVLADHYMWQRTDRV